MAYGYRYEECSICTIRIGYAAGRTAQIPRTESASVAEDESWAAPDRARSILLLFRGEILGAKDALRIQVRCFQP